jgi:hypothetical protein
MNSARSTRASSWRQCILGTILAVACLAGGPVRAQFSCNTPAEGFTAGIPAGWQVVDQAGQGVVWGDLASCGEAANYTGGSGGAACVSSDRHGRAEFATELRTPVFSLAGATSATVDFLVNYQSFVGSDFLDTDISTDGGTTWNTLVRFNEDHGGFRAAPGEAAHVDLSAFAGQTNLRLRWRYYDPNSDDWDWYAQLDNVGLTCPTCTGTVLPDPLLDGGLETGAGWTGSSTNFGTPLCTPATCGFAGARSGSGWAFLGGSSGVPETSALEQTVVLNPSHALLAFYLWNPESSGNGTDAFRLLVDGSQVLAIGAGNALYASGYTRVMADLSSFANGAPHTLRFEGVTSGTPQNTNFFLDDISFSLCQPPPIAIAVSDAAVGEGNSGTTTLSFTVSISPASGSTVTVDYATGGGTATAGSDYVAKTGTVTFTPGQTSQPVTVTVNGDTVDESDETVLLNLSNATGASIADAQGVGTIQDDDTATLAIGSPSVTEGNSGSVNLAFPVTLSTASDHNVSIQAAITGGTATSGTDYTAVAPQSYTFLPGETSKTFTVPVLGDTIDEANETVIVTLSSPSGAAIATGTGTGTIVDDDTATIAINDASVTEGNSGTVAASFTVSLSTSSSQTVTVQYVTANGTALAPADYVAAAGTLTFLPGETSKPVVITVNGDTIDEVDETFSVNLSSPSGAAIADGLGAGTIVDDDTSSITINDVSVTEGNSGTVAATFTVTLSTQNSRNVTVQYATSNGTATAPSDYVAVPLTTLTFLPGETTKPVTVTVNGDSVDEPNETFNVNLSNVSASAVFGDNLGIGTITDDDTSSLSINDVAVTEGNSGTVTATFTVTMSTANSANVTMQVATSNGTAVAPGDYTAVPLTTLTFTPGQLTQTVAVPVVGDTLDEVNETFNVNLSNVSANAVIGDNLGIGTILDDDTATIQINDVSQNEGNSGTSTMGFTVSLTTPSASTVTVTAQTANGTATAGSDYVATGPTVLTFNPGATSQPFNVTINGDATSEPNETVLVNLTAPSGATISRTPGTGTIVNDDTPTMTINSPTIDESSASDPVFTVTLSSPPSSTVTVNYATADATAIAGSDYTAVSGTLTFTAGQTSKTITVPMVRDTLPELTENLTLTLSALSSNAVFPGGVSTLAGTLTITDDDAVTWNLYGDANTTTVPGCITLSQAGWGRGAAYAAKTFPLTEKFDMWFNTYFGTNDLSGGGGMVFVLRKEGSLILGGNDMGYQSITPSVGVEMDTVANYLNDPAYDHLAVDENGGTASHAGAFPVQASATSENIEDGFEHQLHVKRDPAAQRLDAFFDGSLRLSYFKDITNALYGGVSTTYFGMTAGSNCNDSVCPSQLHYFCPVAICIGNTATPQLRVEDVSVSEGSGGSQTATFTVSLYCPRSQTVTVSYATANGTATAGFDYVATSGTLTFAPGDVSKTVSVTILADSTSEPDETFFLNLSSPSGNVALARAQATATIVDDVRFAFGTAGDIPLLGDWNGDGIATPGVFRVDGVGNGTFLLRNSLSSGAADITFSFGQVGDRPLVGDWNGDGIDTVALQRGNNYFLRATNAASSSITTVVAGLNTDIGVAGDWDGDHLDTIGLFRPSTATWYLGGATFAYGLSTDVPITGDWNHDGIDTPGVFRNGVFYLRNSLTTGVADVTIPYGIFSDVPLAGDIDNDGKDSVGFFRNGTTFFLRKF